jgi:diacylglycerol kinase
MSEQPHSPGQPRKWSGTLLRSFHCAIGGIFNLLRRERNARIHLVASVLVAAMAVWLELGRTDCCMLVLAMALVWAGEAFNTALEVLADRVTSEQDQAISMAKDLSAGATLLATLGAVIVGLLIIGPPLWERLGLLARGG